MEWGLEKEGGHTHSRRMFLFHTMSFEETSVLASLMEVLFPAGSSMETH